MIGFFCAICQRAPDEVLATSNCDQQVREYHIYCHGQKIVRRISFMGLELQKCNVNDMVVFKCDIPAAKAEVENLIARLTAKGGTA